MFSFLLHLAPSRRHHTHPFYTKIFSETWWGIVVSRCCSASAADAMTLSLRLYCCKGRLPEVSYFALHTDKYPHTKKRGRPVSERLSHGEPNRNGSPPNYMGRREFCRPIGRESRNQVHHAHTGVLLLPRAAKVTKSARRVREGGIPLTETAEKPLHRDTL